jgi:beta-xylosidase/alpha-L-arabinofuranosidase
MKSMLSKGACTLADLVSPSSAVRRVALAALVVLGGSLTVALAQQPSEAKAPSQVKGVRVFYASHSLMWYVPEPLSHVVAAAGIRGHEVVGVQRIGASRTLQHWEKGEPNEAKAALQGGKVDVFVMSPIQFPDEGVESFVRLGLEHNPDMRFIVQLSWGGGDTDNQDFPKGAWDSADRNKTPEQLRQLYARNIRAGEEQAEAINRKYGKGKRIMTLVPTAQALVELRTRIYEKRMPGLNNQGELFVDAAHPSPPLEALNTYLHYAVLYGKSPVGLPMATPLKAAKREAWDDALSRALQEIAWQAATHYPYSGITTDMARNPILHADVPDVAMIRVGDSYYMSSTTMHMSPGLPLMKSTDLVNWRLVSYAYETLGEEDALTLSNGKSDYGKGSWASSLRHHNGTFYATTFSGTTGKTYVYTTKDIEKGPWQVASFKPMLHDHSLFFDDDGRVYMIYGVGRLRLRELTSDATALKPGGLDQTLIENAGLVAGGKIGLSAEGSQMIKAHGKYYLFNISWPKNDMRTVLVHRADTITGPYEGRVALHDRGVAQGGLIDTPTGEWFAYLFQDCGAVGRVPYLVPVKWADGWPVLGENGKVPETLGLPVSNGLIPGVVASDEFDRRPGEPALPLVWQWNHNPDNRLWSVVARPGWLRLATGRVDADFLAARNTLTQRTFGPECAGVTALDVSHLKDGDCAGLALLQKHYGWVGVKAEGGAKSVVLVSAESGSPAEVQRVPLAQNVVWLKAECDFRNRADQASFFYSLDGATWIALGGTLKMTYTLPHFMGYRFGLFHFATRSPGGRAEFDFFRVSDRLASEEGAPAAVSIKVGPESKAISPDLFGIFFEDINYAADGGLYAELIQNRSFEYQFVEQPGWNPLSFWELVRRGDGKGGMKVDAGIPVHPNNPHHLVLEVEQPGEGVGVSNPGFDGIPVKKGEAYDVSFFARQTYAERRWGGPADVASRPMPVTVRLEGQDGRALGECAFSVQGLDWKRAEASLVASDSDAEARFVLLAKGRGGIALDEVSLFPRSTFKGRANGLRADLAQAIADLRPRFIRFPGGCVAHGNGLGNMYRWRDTVGPVERRKQQSNIWGYHQSAGLGYYEYFQFCEDIGAKPLPVVAAGVCCQNSGCTGEKGQRGLPLDEMPSYVQEVLDLIEWANGPPTSTWGSVRAAAGHPAPFGLVYLGVGNEDQITPVFRERFKLIFDAVRAKHPEIVVVGTAGPSPDGADFEAGWALARSSGVPLLDEHYYRNPEWFWESLGRYDRYDRVGPGVYAGEYAAHDKDRRNTLRSALAEAAYLTSLERNGDIVRLSSYAPLLAKQGHTQWRPDLIYFDNLTVTPSVNYIVQQLFMHNAGDRSAAVAVEGGGAEFAASAVRDTQSGDLVLKLVSRSDKPLSARIDVSVAGAFDDRAMRTVLCGDPLAENAFGRAPATVPEVSTLPAGKTFGCPVPARSLTVLRLRSKR